MKKILRDIGLSVIILIFTYTFAVCSLFSFSSLDPFIERFKDAIAVTTVTYCSGVVAHNVIEKKGLMITVVTMVLLVLYTIVYVASKNYTCFASLFKIGSYILIVLSFIGDAYRIVKTHQEANSNNLLRLFSA